MKKYNYDKRISKQKLFIWLIGEAFFIFVVATTAICLYDTYINIEVKSYDNYTLEKTSEKIEKEENADISDTLEEVSKSIVRNI